MRRLAKQRREDDYASRRDYQAIQEAQSLRIEAKNAALHVVELEKALVANKYGIGGFGGYLRTDASTEISVAVSVDGAKWLTESFTLGNQWSRVGVAFPLQGKAGCKVRLKLTVPTKGIEIWGLDAGPFEPPKLKKPPRLTVADINFSHLLPETLYLPHAEALSLKIDEGATSPFRLESGTRIYLKKCSYCGRRLPLDRRRPGQLAFHKHNAKLSGHQNECRACKKWRINDSFNPLRTVDQLNESSLITRERRLLLREPEILQRIKEREGRGLKSIIWEKFNKKCFHCGKPLKINEVELDHTRPLAYLWPIDEHATCLCAEHNNFKKDKFPVDFYSSSQLKQLSKLTGLSLPQLTERAVCKPELRRILDDIAGFATNWDPRVFNAIARKIREIHPDIDLFEKLAEVDKRLYKKLVKQLADRPPPVTEALAGDGGGLAELEE